MGELRSPDSSGSCIQTRHKQCFLLFFCHFIMYGILHGMSLAIVAMTDNKATNPDFEEFDWDQSTKSTILAGFFWGVMISQIPFGSVSSRYGGKIVLLVGVSANSLINVLIPFLTSIGGSGALIACRIVQGIFQGCLFPGTHTLLANWSPIEERSLLTILCYPGGQVGAVIVLCTGGLISASNFGWPGMFYVWGAGGFLWCIVYGIFGANNPEECRRISEVERDYIVAARGEHNTKIPIIWRRVFRSRPFYALVITQICHGYGFFLLITITPTYIKSVFGLDIHQNALLSSAPFLSMAILSHVFGFIARFLTTKMKFSLRTIRILFNSVGFSIAGVAFLAVGFMKKDDMVLAVVLLTIACGMNSSIYFGYYVNHIDICPTHAGLLAGIANSVSTLNGIFGTMLVGWIVLDEENVQQWQIIFSIGTGFYILGGFVFGIFGRFENQHFTEVKEKFSEDY